MYLIDVVRMYLLAAPIQASPVSCKGRRPIFSLQKYKLIDKIASKNNSVKIKKMLLTYLILVGWGWGQQSRLLSLWRDRGMADNSQKYLVAFKVKEFSAEIVYSMIVQFCLISFPGQQKQCSQGHAKDVTFRRLGRSEEHIIHHVMHTCMYILQIGKIYTYFV